MATTTADRRSSAAPRAGVVHRALDSDIFHSFKRSPVTVLAAVITLVCFIGAIFAIPPAIR